MVRTPRKKSQTGIYHVIFRGINKQTIFEDSLDRIRFLETLRKYKSKSNFEIYGYCLMDNHVHLLIKEGDESISNSIKKISASYVRWYNTKYDRCGYLFQGRFRSETVENPVIFLKVLRYIHQNPLKAGLVANVFESKWNSINEYMGTVSIVNIDYVLSLFSDSKKTAINLLKEYMNESNDDIYLDFETIFRISDSELKDYLSKIGITNISLLQQMKKSDRDAVLVSLKELQGVSLKQLSRVTGISKSVIARAEK